MATHFMPGESRGQRSLAGCIVHRVAKSQTRLSNWHFPKVEHVFLNKHWLKGELSLGNLAISSFSIDKDPSKPENNPDCFMSWEFHKMRHTYVHKCQRKEWSERVGFIEAGKSYYWSLWIYLVDCLIFCNSLSNVALPSTSEPTKFAGSVKERLPLNPSEFLLACKRYLVQVATENFSGWVELKNFVEIWVTFRISKQISQSQLITIYSLSVATWYIK